MLGKNILEFLGNPPMTIDGTLQYQNYNGGEFSTLDVSGLKFFNAVEYGVTVLKAIKDRFVVTIKHHCTSCMKGQKDVDSIEIEVILNGNYAASRIESLAVIDLSMDSAGYFKDIIHSMLNDVLEGYIKDILGG